MAENNDLFDHEKYGCILKEMSPTEVLEHPRMRELLGDDLNLRHIQEQKTSTEKNMCILEQVKRCGEDVFDTFYEILEDTKHYKLLQDLHRIDITEQYSDIWPRVCEMTLKSCQQTIRDDLDPQVTLDKFEEEDFCKQPSMFHIEGVQVCCKMTVFTPRFKNIWPRVCEKTLQSCQQTIQADLDPQVTLNKLEEEEFMQSCRIRDIREQTTTTEKNRMIFTEVRKQGMTGYETFKDILEDTNQDGVYEKLEESENRGLNSLTTSRDILEDYMCYKLKTSGFNCESNSRHESNERVTLFQNVRELCKEFERRYFSEMGHQIDRYLNPQDISASTVSQIFNELFKEDMNWGRVIAAICFLGDVAVSFHKEGTATNDILDWVVQYFAAHVDQWIQEQGGWTGICDFYAGHNTDSEEDAVDGNIESAQQLIKAIKRGTTLSNLQRYTQVLLAVAGAFALGFAFGRR